MLAMTESRDGSFVGETVIPAAGSSADVHINDGRRWWQRCFWRCCYWRRVICMILFPGCPAFCTGMCVVLLESTWLSFHKQAGSPLLKKKKSWHHTTAEKSEGGPPAGAPRKLSFLLNDNRYHDWGIRNLCGTDTESLMGSQRRTHGEPIDEEGRWGRGGSGREKKRKERRRRYKEPESPKAWIWTSLYGINPKRQNLANPMSH